MLYIFLFTIFSVVFAYEKDMTFTVQAGKIDCFYHEVGVSDVIDIEYQVIDASHGELDVSFQLSDPVGRVIVADYKKPENAHRHTSDLAGDYRFCFDNSFSTFSTKTVFFDMLIQTDEEVSKDYDDDKEMEVGDAAETYLMKVRDISESVNKVRDNMASARRLQELHSAHEARDRNLAENLCASVLTWSAWQIVVMIIVGIMQVIDASHGELDVSFQLSDPVGRVIVADYKKPENAHRHTSDLAGDYRFCFDNSFSTFSTKTVFFDMLIQTDEEVSKDYDDDKEMEVGDAAETYLMKVRDISESVNKVRDNMASARRLQELHSAHEARDRNLAENLCASVLTWSAWQIVVMIIVGIMQVFFVKSLFEDAQTNKLNKLMTKLSR